MQEEKEGNKEGAKELERKEWDGVTYKSRKREYRVLCENKKKEENEKRKKKAAEAKRESEV